MRWKYRFKILLNVVKKWKEGIDWDKLYVNGKMVILWLNGKDD